MSEKTEKIKEALDRVYVDRTSLNRIYKDRLDFGFDSIYFRYAMARDELAYYKAAYQKQVGSYEEEQRRANNDKMRFYRVLEQLTLAHEEEDKI